uniref:Uncharacterized protein n=1 Tax=Rhizophora mucronata TaxID=61149 RepID=A0A2P2JB38_RHIMU
MEDHTMVKGLGFAILVFVKKWSL